MSRNDRDRVQFHIEAETETEAEAASEDTPFRIALIGDWSCGANRSGLASGRPIQVDRDNYDAVLKRLAPMVQTQAGQISIRDLDDFHPDALFATVPIFDALRGQRTDLLDPGASVPLEKENPAPAAAAVPISSGNLLDDLLDASETGAAAAPARPVSTIDPELRRLIDQAVKPHLVARQDPRTPQLVQQVDDAACQVMRRILHDERFRRAEASWRALFQIVRELETGSELQLFLIDATKDDIAKDAKEFAEILERNGLWAVLALNFSVGAADLRFLNFVARIGAAAGGPVLAEADGSLLDGGPEWQEFRKSEAAPWVGLALPRILLRLPYGRNGLECETFAFEEMDDKPDRKQLLFGNPALFCAMLLGQSFTSEGWDMRPGSVRDIEGRPVYVYYEDGDAMAVPCAEVELTESTAGALMDAGFMPAAAIRGKDVVRILRFQSVSDPPQPLRGRWA